MKVIGEGSVDFFGGEMECVHAPGPEDLWQESFVIYLWDVERHVYVFFRIAQTPNWQGGTAQVWLNIWTNELMYKHTSDSVPFDGSGRSENALNIGDGLCEYSYDGNFNWKLNDKQYDASATLTFEGFHPGVNYFPGDAGSLLKHAAANHTQATGWVTGTVTVKGKRYEVAGQGWRDHSWGYRDWKAFRAHRFFPAMFGRDFNFFNVSFIGDDGRLVKYGAVFREDSVQFVHDFDIIAYMGEDGVSVAGGKVILRLDGNTHELNYELLGKSAINMVHGGQCVDGMCRVKMGDRIGVGVSETSERAQGGDERPYVFPSSPGVIDNGIFDTPEEYRR